MKNVVSLVITAFFLTLVVATVLAPATTSVAQREEGNLVSVDFTEAVSGCVPGDTFTNSELTGDRVWRIASIRNTDDKTGAPVKDLKVTLDSKITFDGISPKEHMTIMGPPIYEWCYGDLVEESQHQEWYIDAVMMVSNYHSTITPGFDASRSFDKTAFTVSSPQTLTITVTPREEWLEKVTVCIIADESDLVDPIIESYSPTGAEVIKLTDNNHRLALDWIPVKLNVPLNITVTLQINPKIASLSYKPRISVIPEKQVEAETGTVTGSSVSYTMPEVGTWTVSAEGDYVWNWGKPNWIRGTIMFDKMIKSNESNEQAVSGEGQVPVRAKPPISWHFITGIIIGAVILIGLSIYFFIRRQRKNAA